MKYNQGYKEAEKYTHNKEKNQSIKIILELTQMLELSDINIKMCIIIAFNMFKNLSRGME